MREQGGLVSFCRPAMELLHAQINSPRTLRLRTDQCSCPVQTLWSTTAKPIQQQHDIEHSGRAVHKIPHFIYEVSLTQPTVARKSHTALALSAQSQDSYHETRLRQDVHDLQQGPRGGSPRLSGHAMEIVRSIRHSTSSILVNAYLSPRITAIWTAHS